MEPVRNSSRQIRSGGNSYRPACYGSQLSDFLTGRGWLLLAASVAIHGFAVLWLPSLNHPGQSNSQVLHVLLAGTAPSLQSKQPDASVVEQSEPDQPPLASASVPVKIPAAREDSTPPEPPAVLQSETLPVAKESAVVLDQVAGLETSAFAHDRSSGVQPVVIPTPLKTENSKGNESALPESGQPQLAAVPESATTAEPAIDLKTLLTDYASRVKAAILQQRSYPRSAERLGQQGSAEVRFTILADGSLDALRISAGSGHDSLDSAALAAVRAADPFAPLPAALGRDRLTLSITLNFNLE